MDLLQHQAAQSTYLIRPSTALFAGQSVQFLQQRWNLPAIEDGVAIRVQRTEKRERRLVEIAKRRVPGEATCCPRHDLTTKFVAHLHTDHRDMLTAASRTAMAVPVTPSDNRANVAYCGTRAP